jgi:hypothetical protein
MYSGGPIRSALIVKGKRIPRELKLVRDRKYKGLSAQLKVRPFKAA